MSFLGLFGKKKKSELQLPPPPRIDSQEFVSDIPEIRLDEIPEPPKQKSAKALPPEISDESLPEFPSFPSVEPVEGEPSENVPFHKAEFVVEEESLPKKDDSVVFDRTIHVASQKPVEVMHKKLTSYKTFVSLDDYSAISQSANVVQSSLADAESLVKRLNQLRIEETKTVDKWISRLEDMEKKLAQVDKVLAHAQS